MKHQACAPYDSIKNEDIIRFEEGIPGFSGYQDFVLIQDEDSSAVMCLQSAVSETPSFVVIDPFAFIDSYEPMLSQADLDYFQVQSVEELRFLAITVLSKNILDSVVNLKSPIVMNPQTRTAKQVLLDNNQYPIRYSLFKNIG